METHSILWLASPFVWGLSLTPIPTPPLPNPPPQPQLVTRGDKQYVIALPIDTPVVVVDEKYTALELGFDTRLPAMLPTVSFRRQVWSVEPYIVEAGHVYICVYGVHSHVYICA